jgi:hypothetical protein
VTDRNPERLYSLIPAIHRIRDAERGYPLRALLRLIGDSAQSIEDDLAVLYQAWFIETCPDWVVPYIGELIGYVSAHEVGSAGLADLADASALARALAPRRDVANTIHDRRRKGTIALLESIAGDSAGWPARALEFFRRVTWAQNLNHLHPRRGGTASLRRVSTRRDPEGPFDTVAHTPDLRRPNSSGTVGLYSIPSVGLFAWRLRAYTVTRCQAYCLEDFGPQCYAFSALGNDTQLFNHPQPDTGGAVPSGPSALPVPITRALLEDRLRPDPNRQPPIQSIASVEYWGLTKGLALWAPDWPVRGAPQPVPREAILPADLSDWSYEAPRNHIAVDPELGRIAFPPRQLPRSSVQVSYAYGFAAPIGGGEYERPKLAPHGSVIYRVGHARPGAESSIHAALARWRSAEPRPGSAVIEIVDSFVYTEPISVELDAEESLKIRAANRVRPIIRLLDYMVDRPDPFSVRGRRGSQFTLEGVIVTGRGLAILGPNGEGDGNERDDLCEVVIRHSTLVPGWGLHCDCEPLRPAEPSVALQSSRTRLRIEHSIVGSIVVSTEPVGFEPSRIDLSDSILDATGHDCDRPDCQALTAPDGRIAHAAVSFRRCTVFGRVRTHSITLAENSLFSGRVWVARRQAGCMRFCYVPQGSRTPRPATNASRTARSRDWRQARHCSRNCASVHNS